MQYLNSELTVWRMVNKIPEVVFLSLLWLVLCLPIVTIPCASMALYDSIARNVIPDEKGAYRRFFRTFRNELKQGVFVGLLWTGIVALLLLGHYLMARYLVPDNNTTIFLFYVYRVIVLGIPLSILSWLVPLQSRFVYNFSTVHKVAISYCFAFFPYTLITVVLIALILFLMFYFPAVFLTAPIFTPALFAMLQSVWVEKIFKKEIEKNMSPEELAAKKREEALAEAGKL